MKDLEEYLLHYASEYYDPIKAHEFYMKNRELKGRTTKGMSTEQREAWGFAKENIRNEKKSKVEEAKTTKEKQIEDFRAKAEATRQRIAEKLKMLIEQIEEKKKNELEKLEDIPKNISPEQRAKLMEKRKKKIADLREDSKENKDEVRDDVKVEREKTRTELKSLITNARETYKIAKADLDVKYEKIYQTEYDNIKTNIKGSTKTRRKK